MRISIYIDSFFVDFKKRFLSFQCVFFWLKTGFCLKINQKTKQTTPSSPTESKGLEKPSFPSFMAQMKIGSKVVELNMLKIRAITNDFALWFDFQVRFSFYLSNSTHFQLVVNIFQKNDNSASIPSHDWIPLPQVSP